MDKKILNILGEFLVLDNWDAVHLSITVGNRKNEIFITNPLFNTVETQHIDVIPNIEVPVVKETMAEKIQRFRTAPLGGLTKEEEIWWKERQSDLEKNGIGQILPETPIAEAVAKMAQIGERDDA